MAQPPKAALDKAVRAAQLYCGSADYASVRAQQRLYDRMRRAAAPLVVKTGMSEADVLDQMLREAQRRGCIRPIPGQHL